MYFLNQHLKIYDVIHSFLKASDCDFEEKNSCNKHRIWFIEHNFGIRYVFLLQYKGPGKRGHKFVSGTQKRFPILFRNIFVSATNVSQFAQPRKHHGQQCVRNNVSS